MLIAILAFLLPVLATFFILKRRRSWPRAIGVIGLVFSSLLLALVSGLALLMWGCEPPSLKTLAKRFPSQRHDLETILNMADQDKIFSRIAPTFLDRCDDPTCQTGGRFMEGDPNAGLTKQRWDDYRAIYNRNRITLGIQRDLATDDAFIMVDSVGLLNRGHATGFLHCGLGPRHYYPPCNSNSDSGHHKFTGHSMPDEGYSFIRLVDRWFAFDEGPS